MPKKSECPRSGCPLTNALDHLGDRWSLLVIRDLMFFGRHEFREFLEAGEGVATNILSDRLKRLSADGIIASVPHPTNKTRKLYYLTEKGKSLLPLMRELILWGDEHCEGSKAPKDRIRLLREQGELVKREVLANLSRWEEENLPGGKSPAKDSAAGDQLLRKSR